MRRQGCSVDRGNYINSVMIVAVPVPNARKTMSPGRAAAGLASQLNRATATSSRRNLQTAAATAASQLPSSQ